MSQNQNKIYKAIVVDDERLARKELIKMLEEFNNVDVVGDADSVDSAVIQIEEKSPDIVFLDIQMPGKSGFDLLDEVDFNGTIIFVTAYDAYAIRAFEVNALDYLLKPVSHERLEKAISRVVSDMPNEIIITKGLELSDRLFLTIGNQMKFICVNSIVAILAEGDYTMLYLNDGSRGLVTKPMKEWETRLPIATFCRIHRSSIINTDYVEKVEKWFNYSYRIYLKHLDEPLVVSRRYAKKIKDQFS